MPGLPKLNRANPLLNDALDVIDMRFHEARRLLPKGSPEERISLAWTLLSQIELDFVQEQIHLCVTDRVYYLTNYHVITDEQGREMCMNPLFDLQWLVENAIQKERAATGQSRIIVLKPRQSGITVYSTGVMNHCALFTPSSYTVIVAQAPDVAAHVQRLINITYNSLPWWMRPEILYRSKGEYLEFNRKNLSDRTTDPGLGSVIVTTHAQRDSGVAIGRTVRNALLTEVSRWPSGEVWTGDIEPALNATDTNAICESTALGADGFFYNLWTEAMEGESDWIPVFLPVYKARKYSLPLKPNQLPFKLTELETAIRQKVQEEENFTVTDEYFNWRRRRLKSAIKRTGFPYSHYECYPLTPSEAFQSSGICAFPRHKLDEQQAYIRRPKFVGEIGFRGINAVPKLLLNTVQAHHALTEKREHTNRLYIWEKPEPRSLYYLAADVADGNGGDFSVAEILRVGSGNSPDVQVAEWVGYEQPKAFAKILYALGFYYNRCEIAVEYAKEGMTTANSLYGDLEYPNIYRPRSRDRIGKQLASFLHWQTTSRTKPLIVSQMAETLLEDQVIIRSQYCLDEMRKFSKSGAGYSGLGSHDDSVMAMCICLFCLRETLPELRVQPSYEDGGNTSPTVSARASGGAVIYGVYDSFMRLRTQTPSLDAAQELIAKAKKQAKKDGPMSPAGRAWGPNGWGIKQIMVSKANTAYSIIHHGTGIESELFREQGMDSWDVLPGVVSRYREQTGRQEGMWEPGGVGVGEGMSNGRPEIAPPGTRPQATPPQLALSARVDRGGGEAGLEAAWLNEQLVGSTGGGDIGGM